MQTIIVYILAVIGICVIAKIFSAPLKLILKLLINALTGGLALIIINLIGNLFNFHIELNLFSALITGTLGIPGIVILLILKVII